MITMEIGSDDEPKWYANVMITRGEGNLRHVLCSTDGKTKDAALTAAKYVLDMLFKDNIYIRDQPWSDSETSFETKIIRHRGGTRFTFEDDKEGPW